MNIDEQKVDEISLALLYLTTFDDRSGVRTWKSYSWDVLDRLHENGFIENPQSKAKSVLLTEEGAKRSKALFEKHFSIHSDDCAPTVDPEGIEIVVCGPTNRHGQRSVS